MEDVQKACLQYVEIQELIDYLHTNRNMSNDDIWRHIFEKLPFGLYYKDSAFYFRQETEPFDIAHWITHVMSKKALIESEQLKEFKEFLDTKDIYFNPRERKQALHESEGDFNQAWLKLSQ